MNCFLRLAPFALIALAACSAQPPSTQTASALGSTTDCIDQKYVVSRYPAGDQAMIFEMNGGATYRNQLLSTCPNLGKRTAGDSYQFNIKGGDRICMNDEFRAFDPIEARVTGTRSYPTCRLGRFTRIERP
jgi:hypothetical protein